ncbi:MULTISPECIES: hypothetical protein [Paraclostridium]|uniref:Uncharacterized protein n=1 Tax=Paraclostridium bifermentans TaxID=1490 RepID=A0AA44DMM0_PARBF|nr:hypothetical protein [Paraclostridium bifermentans]MBN8049073.1 hypothetical protein [Paraclostridium bifermentans]NME10548.1 hypothetical protein [Paraclostridium bifermentans]
MEKNKRSVLIIGFILIFCSMLIFILNRYGLTQLYVIFQRIIHLLTA